MRRPVIVLTPQEDQFRAPQGWQSSFSGCTVSGSAMASRLGFPAQEDQVTALNALNVRLTLILVHSKNTPAFRAWRGGIESPVGSHHHYITPSISHDWLTTWIHSPLRTSEYACISHPAQLVVLRNTL